MSPVRMNPPPTSVNRQPTPHPLNPASTQSLPPPTHHPPSQFGGDQSAWRAAPIVLLLLLSSLQHFSCQSVSTRRPGCCTSSLFVVAVVVAVVGVLLFSPRFLSLPFEAVPKSFFSGGRGLKVGINLAKFVGRQVWDLSVTSQRWDQRRL